MQIIFITYTVETICIIDSTKKKQKKEARTIKIWKPNYENTLIQVI